MPPRKPRAAIVPPPPTAAAAKGPPFDHPDTGPDGRPWWEHELFPICDYDPDTLAAYHRSDARYGAPAFFTVTAVEHGVQAAIPGKFSFEAYPSLEAFAAKFGAGRFVIRAWASMRDDLGQEKIRATRGRTLVIRGEPEPPEEETEEEEEEEEKEAAPEGPEPQAAYVQSLIARMEKREEEIRRYERDLNKQALLQQGQFFQAMLETLKSAPAQVVAAAPSRPPPTVVDSLRELAEMKTVMQSLGMVGGTNVDVEKTKAWQGLAEQFIGAAGTIATQIIDAKKELDLAKAGVELVDGEEEDEPGKTAPPATAPAHPPLTGAPTPRTMTTGGAR